MYLIVARYKTVCKPSRVEAVPVVVFYASVMYARMQVEKGLWKVVRLPNDVLLETKRMRDMELW